MEETINKIMDIAFQVTEFENEVIKKSQPIPENSKIMENNFYYSEGYVYQEKDTIAQLFGTEQQQEELGKYICEMLNKKL